MGHLSRQRYFYLVRGISWDARNQSDLARSLRQQRPSRRLSRRYKLTRQKCDLVQRIAKKELGLCSHLAWLLNRILAQASRNAIWQSSPMITLAV